MHIAYALTAICADCSNTQLAFAQQVKIHIGSCFFSTRLKAGAPQVQNIFFVLLKNSVVSRTSAVHQTHIDAYCMCHALFKICQKYFCSTLLQNFAILFS